MTPLTEDDRFLIQILRTDEGFKSFQIFNEFLDRRWKKRLIRKIDEAGTSSRKTRESVRTARAPANITRVSELICSQDDDLGTSKSGDTCSNLCVDRRSVTLNMSKRSLLTVGQRSVSSSLTERLSICLVA